MQKYGEIAKITLELLETMENGIEFVSGSLEQDEYQSAGKMLTDILTGFFQIEKSLSPLVAELNLNYIAEYTEQLRQEFENVVKLYENKDYDGLAELVDKKLSPLLSQWQTEIKRCLINYLTECEEQ